MTDMSNVEFIRDLAARMFRNATPAMGFDQGDTDRLYVIANRLAALEQAGEPVADALGYIQRFHKSYICLGGDDDGEEYVRWSDVLAALPTLQRLGQEFDAGEAVLVDGDAAKHMRALGHIKDTIPSYMGDAPKAQHYQALHAALDAGMDAIQNVARHAHKPVAYYYSDGQQEWLSMRDDDAPKADCEYKIIPLYAHPPQSRVAAEPVGLREAEAIAGHAVARIDNFLAKFGGFEAYASLAENGTTTGWSQLRSTIWRAVKDAINATPSQPDPQSRGQAFDGEGEARADDIRRSIIRQLGDDPHADRIILPGTDWDIARAALSESREAGDSLAGGDRV